MAARGGDGGAPPVRGLRLHLRRRVPVGALHLRDQVVLAGRVQPGDEVGEVVGPLTVVDVGDREVQTEVLREGADRRVAVQVVGRRLLPKAGVGDHEVGVGLGRLPQRLHRELAYRRRPDRPVLVDVRQLGRFAGLGVRADRGEQALDDPAVVGAQEGVEPLGGRHGRHLLGEVARDDAQHLREQRVRGYLAGRVLAVEPREVRRHLVGELLLSVPLAELPQARLHGAAGGVHRGPVHVERRRHRRRRRQVLRVEPQRRHGGPLAGRDPRPHAHLVAHDAGDGDGALRLAGHGEHAPLRRLRLRRGGGGLERHHLEGDAKHLRDLLLELPVLADLVEPPPEGAAHDLLAQ